MRFPGKRKTKHYFPVADTGRVSFDTDFSRKENIYLVGIDQLLVDIEVEVDDEFLQKYSIPKGESCVLDDKLVEEIYQTLVNEDRIIGEYAGGAIGNTLHNYSILSDDKSIALGTICKNIHVGDYAFKYICTTSSKVDFSYLQPKEGKMARAMCFLTPDHERSFAIGKGIMNELDSEFIPENVISGASSLLISTYLLRDESSPLFKSTMKAIEVAKKSNVPVILSLGTSSLVAEKREFFLDILKNYVTIVAMNEQEAKELFLETDPLLAGEKSLDYVDMTLLTVGKRGLYICGHVDESMARETKDLIHSKSISEYNKYEYSRAMKKASCIKPIKIYTHINPYMGGPGEIKNTNGAGDAALAAVLHDISANSYHKELIPNSPKHETEFLTYSSIHQVCKYANRVSYEVLKQNSPRLYQGLPTKEQSLEESYWDL
ncbi:inosine-guanosine kinase [Halobacteriovorax marinus SJ]|uniref:Inosine-guanosine kinase n=1 Tax=Halobacteriovorax marinus (strain ATCC BAA-682 / DSM 15412 / SJ) TaxID=862908 RepID=E1X2J0_HALMS|nr:inosine/guanosine kinase [Halobacteriovorax marinus]CBW26757.1 inosine-guanosine kinase [Halobacteriovorax marinus SJ]